LCIYKKKLKVKNSFIIVLNKKKIKLTYFNKAITQLDKIFNKYKKPITKINVPSN